MSMKTCTSPYGDGIISKVFWDIIEKDFFWGYKKMVHIFYPAILNIMEG
jgi:hypothetical protein